MCGHECYVIGGPWIAENPNCPIHGSKPEFSVSESEVNEIIRKVSDGEMTYKGGYYALARIHGYFI